MGNIVMAQLPKEITINGDKFVPVLMRVEDRDELGRVDNLVCLHDDSIVEVHGTEQFLVVYAMKACVEAPPP